MLNKKRYIVDIDGTICTKTYGSYEDAQPYMDRIRHVNALHDEGHVIIYWTARGGNTGTDHTELTKRQLRLWGCRYTELKLFKPSYDIWIDDKAFNSEEYFQ